MVFWYGVHLLGKDVNLVAKWLPEIEAENRLKGNHVLVEVGFSF